jgi:hypothetical protein
MNITDDKKVPKRKHLISEELDMVIVIDQKDWQKVV